MGKNIKQMEEGTSGNKRSITTDEGELWIGEKGAVGEDMRDIGSRRRGYLFSDIEEEI